MSLIKSLSKIFFFLIIALLASLITINGFKHLYPFYEYSQFVLKKIDWLNLYLPALYSHILSSGIIIIVGLLGFSENIRLNNIKLHKNLGKIYVVLILFLSAPAGLIMALLASGGISVKLCFIALSVLWFTFTLQAWKKIKEKDVAGHRKMMIRSYALTLSAIALRLYSFIFSIMGVQNNEATYVWYAWFSWVPNLIIVESYFYLKKSSN